MKTLKKKVVDYAALIKEAMAKPQRKAPCISAKVQSPQGSHEGTLLMCESELLFFKGSGSSVTDVVLSIAYGDIKDWGSDLLRGTAGPPALTVDHGKHQTHFSPTDDSADSINEWVQSTMIYLDLVVLRWMGTQAYSAIVEDVVPDQQEVDEDTLLFDRRALRLPAGISASQRTVSGHRFPCKWVFFISGLKGLVKGTHETEIPCIAVPSDLGLLVMLPQQKGTKTSISCPKRHCCSLLLFLYSLFAFLLERNPFVWIAQELFLVQTHTHGQNFKAHHVCIPTRSRGPVA